jgi:uncharacterized protein (TIGR00369 family)
MDPQFTTAEMHDFLREVFPQVGDRFEVVALEPMQARVRMIAGEADLRPGGTVSGPTLFTLADVAFYIATLAMIGRQALAVTTSVSLDFMRKAGPGPLEAEARILKLGRVLVVGDVVIRAEGLDGAIARAGLTYSIPPRREAAGSGSAAMT